MSLRSSGLVFGVKFKAPIDPPAWRTNATAPKASKAAAAGVHALAGGTSGSLDVLLADWDRGNKPRRIRILHRLLALHGGATAPELEAAFANGASLLLTRVTAWLRLTYLLGFEVGLQLRAIGVFVGAASGHRFLAEFVEVGGIATALDVLTVQRLMDEDKVAALDVLAAIANAGRSYKELVCGADGVRAVVACLGHSTEEALSESARLLLLLLVKGNDAYAEASTALLLNAGARSGNALAQRVCAQVCRSLLQDGTVRVQVDHSAASPVPAPGVAFAGEGEQQIMPSRATVAEWGVGALQLLASTNLQVQYEGFELVKALLVAPPREAALRSGLLAGLVSALVQPLPKEWCSPAIPMQTQSEAELQTVLRSPSDLEMSALEAAEPLPVAVFAALQSGTAKLIALISTESAAVAAELAAAGAVHNLCGMLLAHPAGETRKEAALALRALSMQAAEALEILTDILGDVAADLAEDADRGLAAAVHMDATPAMARAVKPDLGELWC